MRSTTVGVDSCVGEGFGFEEFPEGVFCNWVLSRRCRRLFCRIGRGRAFGADRITVASVKGCESLTAMVFSMLAGFRLLLSVGWSFECFRTSFDHEVPR